MSRGTTGWTFEGTRPRPSAIASQPTIRSTRSGRNTRVLVGSYDFHLLRMDGRWQIDSLRFNLKYIDGNTDLEPGELGAGANS